MRTHPVELFRAEGMPVLQNRVYPTHEEARACPVGDVALAQDPETGIVHNRVFDPGKIVYDSAYNNEQGLSPAFREHLQSIAGLIDRHFKGQNLIEIGCGKGGFLELLRAGGFSVTGVDPAYEGDDPSILKQLFSPGIGIRAEGIVLRHVLEHIPRPLEFLEQIRQANGGGGRIYIEVPCLEWILDRNAWYDVFYEHVNYFRLSDFRRIFATIHHADHCFHGQYLSIVADLATLRAPESIGDEVLIPDRFMESIDAHASTIRTRRNAGGPPTVIWGAASKGVIFALHLERAGAPVDGVVDINPAKQGRFLPATGLRVLSPEEAISSLPAGSHIIVVNPNYLDEVAAATEGTFSCATI